MTHTDIYAMLDQGIAGIIQGKYGQTTYAHLSRGSKTQWELTINNSPRINGTSHTVIRFDGDKRRARRIARQYNAVAWNF